MNKKVRAQQKPWHIHFFKRHEEDDSDRAIPGQRFLDACPTSVRAKLIATIKAVADAPPPTFSGGGKWEAMHGEMSGFYEARADGEGRAHFRLFCILERKGENTGLGGPSLVIITGMKKSFRTTFSVDDYDEVREPVPSTSRARHGRSASGALAPCEPSTKREARGEAHSRARPKA